MGRVGVRLSDDEAWDVVARSHTGIFTSLRADGTPIALPVWFVVVDRRVYVSGPATAKKLVRVRRNPRVSFLVESGERWRDLRAVHVTGTARIVDAGERDLLARIAADADAKYSPFRTAREEMPDATRRHYAVEAGVIEITPDPRLLTWDNARLFAEPGAR
jgi:nitroimidazol reductase NimA-like FMN-containing flavoprotein (pyridoxamine 5'-phosphate oxidase superfamily)